MIVKNNTDPAIERLKQRLNLTGDVYLYNEHFIENLESHKRLVPISIAETIEDAFYERVAWEEEQAEKQRLAFEQYKLEHPDEFLSEN